jgi:uncharacterized protein YegL
MWTIRFFLLFILIPLAASAYNPIDEGLSIGPVKARGFKVIASIPGSRNNPGSLIFDFGLRDEKGGNIFFLEKENFRFRIGGQTAAQFLCQPSANAYRFFIPRLPVQPKDGLYKLSADVFVSNSGWKTFDLWDGVEYTSGHFDLILIVDTSTSMRLNDKENFRQKAILNILSWASQNDSVSRISVIKFSTVANVACPLTSVHDSQVLHDAVSQIDSAGETAIGDGLDKAYSQVVLGRAGNKAGKFAVILLTDGENNGPWVDNHLAFKKAGVPVYTIGLTQAVNSAFLQRIASDTGGQYFQIPDSFRIQNIYYEIINRENSKRVFFSRDMTLRPGQTTNFIFKPGHPLVKINVFTSWAHDDVSVSLDPSPEAVESSGFSGFQNRELTGLQDRRYTFNIRNKSPAGAGPNPFSIFGFVNTDITLKLYLPKKTWHSGEPVEVSLLAYQDDHPLTDLKVSLRFSSVRTNSTIVLPDDGLHNDGSKDDGLYRSYFFRSAPGKWNLTCRIKGKNLYGDIFEKQVTEQIKVTESRTSSDLEITPLKIMFERAGADVDCYQSFRLISGSTNRGSLRVIGLPVSLSNGLSDRAVSVKPDRFILEPVRNKLFNISVRIPFAASSGKYEGNLVLQRDDEFLRVPLSIVYDKYAIPENSEKVR